MDKMRKRDMPTVATGMDDHEELNQNANRNEIEKGEFTEVTTLSFDEVEPSEDNS